MPAADVINRLLLCATGIPLGIAIGVAVDHWRDRPQPPTTVGVDPAAAGAPAVDPLDAAIATTTQRRRQLERELEARRATLADLLSTREAAGLSRAQREARKIDADPLLGGDHDLGLCLDAEVLLARRLAWRAEPAAPEGLPQETWHLADRTPVGALAGGRLDLLRDDATLLAAGEQRLLLIDRELRAVRSEHPLPAAPIAWASDDAGRELVVGTAGAHLLAWRVADGMRRGVSACDGPILAAIATTDGWAVATTAGIELRDRQLLLRGQLAWPGVAPTAATATSDGLIALAAGACYRWRPGRDTGPAAIALDLKPPTAAPIPDGAGLRLAWAEGDGTAVLDLGASDGPTIARIADAPFVGWCPGPLVLTAAGQALIARDPGDLQPRAVLQGAAAPTHHHAGLLATAGDPWVLWEGATRLPLQGLRGGHAHPVDVVPHAQGAVSLHTDGQLWWWRREAAP